MNMIEAEGMFATIKLFKDKNASTYPINESGYITICNFSMVKQDFIMFSKSFSIKYDDNTELYGSLHETTNQDIIGIILCQPLETFMNHNEGDIDITRQVIWNNIL